MPIPSSTARDGRYTALRLAPKGAPRLKDISPTTEIGSGGYLLRLGAYPWGSRAHT